MKDRDSIDVVSKRLKKSERHHFVKAFGLGVPMAGSLVLAVPGLILCQQQGVNGRAGKVADSRKALKDASRAASAEQRADAIAIVKAGLIKAGIVDQETNAGVKLIGKSKYALLLAQTLEAVKGAKPEHLQNIPGKAKLADPVKDVLSNIVADNLKDNKKQETTFRNIKGKFERKGHVGMGEGGYMVKEKLQNSLNSTNSHSQKISLRNSSSSSVSLSM